MYRHCPKLSAVEDKNNNKDFVLLSDRSGTENDTNGRPQLKSTIERGTSQQETNKEAFSVAATTADNGDSLESLIILLVGGKIETSKAEASGSSERGSDEANADASVSAAGASDDPALPRTSPIDVKPADLLRPASGQESSGFIEFISKTKPNSGLNLNYSAGSNSNNNDLFILAAGTSARVEARRQGEGQANEWRAGQRAIKIIDNNDKLTFLKLKPSLSSSAAAVAMSPRRYYSARTIECAANGGAEPEPGAGRNSPLGALLSSLINCEEFLAELARLSNCSLAATRATKSKRLASRQVKVPSEPGAEAARGRSLNDDAGVIVVVVLFGSEPLDLNRSQQWVQYSENEPAGTGASRTMTTTRGSKTTLNKHTMTTATTTNEQAPNGKLNIELAECLEGALEILNIAVKDEELEFETRNNISKAIELLTGGIPSASASRGRAQAPASADDNANTTVDDDDKEDNKIFTMLIIESKSMDRGEVWARKPMRTRARIQFQDVAETEPAARQAANDASPTTRLRASHRSRSDEFQDNHQTNNDDYEPSRGQVGNRNYFNEGKLKSRVVGVGGAEIDSLDNNNGRNHSAGNNNGPRRCPASSCSPASELIGFGGRRRLRSGRDQFQSSDKLAARDYNTPSRAPTKPCRLCHGSAASILWLGFPIKGDEDIALAARRLWAEAISANFVALAGELNHNGLEAKVSLIADDNNERPNNNSLPNSGGHRDDFAYVYLRNFGHEGYKFVGGARVNYGIATKANKDKRRPSELSDSRESSLLLSETNRASKSLGGAKQQPRSLSLGRSYAEPEVDNLEANKKRTKRAPGEWAAQDEPMTLEDKHIRRAGISKSLADFTDSPARRPTAGSKVKSCALFDDKPYVIYSALGSFYIPMLIMIFFYSRIYLVASRAHKAMQRGYMTTKWPATKNKSNNNSINQLLSSNSQTNNANSQSNCDNSDQTSLRINVQSSNGKCMNNDDIMNCDRVTLRIHRKEKTTANPASSATQPTLSGNANGGGGETNLCQPTSGGQQHNNLEESKLMRLTFAEQQQRQIIKLNQARQAGETSQVQLAKGQEQTKPPEFEKCPATELTTSPVKIPTADEIGDEQSLRDDHCSRHHHHHHSHHHHHHHRHHHHRHRHHRKHRHHHYHHSSSCSSIGSDKSSRSNEACDRTDCRHRTAAAAATDTIKLINNDSRGSVHESRPLMHSSIAEESSSIIINGSKNTSTLKQEDREQQTAAMTSDGPRRTSVDVSSINSVQITVSQYDSAENNNCHAGQHQQRQQTVAGSGPAAIFIDITPPAIVSSDAADKGNPIGACPNNNNKFERSQSVDVDDNDGAGSEPATDAISQTKTDRSHSCVPNPTIVVNWNPETNVTDSRLHPEISIADEQLAKSSPSLLVRANTGSSNPDHQSLAGSQGSGLSIMANIPNQVRKQSMMLLSTFTNKSSQTLRRLSMVAAHPVDSILNRGKNDSNSNGLSRKNNKKPKSGKGKRKARLAGTRGSKSLSTTPAAMSPSVHGNSKKTLDDYLMAVAGIDSSTDENDYDQSDADDDEDISDEEEGDDDDDDDQIDFGASPLNGHRPAGSNNKTDIETGVVASYEDNNLFIHDNKELELLMPKIDAAMSKDEVAEQAPQEKPRTPMTDGYADIDKGERSASSSSLRPTSGLQRKGGYYERATSRSGSMEPSSHEGQMGSAQLATNKTGHFMSSLVGRSLINGRLATTGSQERSLNDKCSSSNGASNSASNRTIGMNVHRRRRQTSKWHAKRLHAETKAAKTVAIIVGGFIFCWLPFFTAYLSRAIICEKPDCIPHTLLSLFIWLGYLNSAINPVIYGLFSADFRHAFKNIICRCRFRNTDDTIVVSVLVDSIIKSIL